MDTRVNHVLAKHGIFISDYNSFAFVPKARNKLSLPFFLFFFQKTYFISRNYHLLKQHSFRSLIHFLTSRFKRRGILCWTNNFAWRRGVTEIQKRLIYTLKNCFVPSFVYLFRPNNNGNVNLMQTQRLLNQTVRKINVTKR